MEGTTREQFTMSNVLQSDASLRWEFLIGQEKEGGDLKRKEEEGEVAPAAPLTWRNAEHHPEVTTKRKFYKSFLCTSQVTTRINPLNGNDESNSLWIF